MKQVLLGLALLLIWPGLAFAQDGVEVALEAFIVTTVTGDDGETTEEFQQADTARPGQIVEYRVVVTNISGETLAAASVAVTGPVPANTIYIDGTATTSDAYRTEFSADGGAAFSIPPVMIMVTNDDGEEEEVIADPAQYNAARWTFLEALEADTVHTLVYRVEVR